ncbi:MAG: DUF2298 domain-containing protein [Candidatus Daviesbacteria bacterium]|nr:DUF2298 domain-containing protein [Candidatus Daviesbacteria bacterium]
MISDLIFILQWWFIWFILGIGFLPFTTTLFSNFFDKGYAFSKILGLLLLGYAVWFLGSIKILPFSTWSIILIFIIFAFLQLKFLKHIKSLKLNKIFIFEEILFLVGFIFWAFVRAHEPSIHGLEKFMDFGIINSILRTDYFPPKDLWMTPLSINYYYFGHFASALLTKISGIDSIITYNLTLASLFALTLTASFSLGANLYHFFVSSTQKLHAIRYTLISGALSAFLVTLGGNLQTIYAFFRNYSPDNPVPFWTLQPMLNFIGYWYPNATRFIPFTIHEFPLYSFVVADLHGHVFNIPFVLLLLALLIVMFFQQKLNSLFLILVSLLVAVSLMTNILDGPIYIIVIFAVLFAKNWSQSNKFSFSIIHDSLFLILLITLGAILFSLPFWLAFIPFAQGVGVLCAPSFLTDFGKIGPFLFEKDHCQKSPIWMLAILWGFFYFVILGFIFFILKFKIDLKFKIKNLKLEPTDLLVLTFALAATILLIIPEFFYAKDIYPAHYRANTVFKFGYQAFIILGLVSSYMITRLISKLETRNSKLFLPFFLILISLFFLVAIYPYFAIKSYYGDLKNYQSLNGLNYFSPLYPTDYQAILWLRENIPGQPVILEAQGDSYTDFARVSSNTGLPTVIGWPVHEWLWRGSFDEAGKRGTDVAILYESPDLNLTQTLLQKYNVQYVFIGSLERQKYSKLNEEKFNALGKIIFQDGPTEIYQLN